MANSPFNAKQVATKIGVKGKDAEMIPFLLEQMMHSGELKEVGKGRYQAVATAQTIQGRMDINLKGNGYLIPEDGTPDVFISAAFLNTALNRDTVKVQLFASRNAAKPEGEVTEIVERNRMKFVGRLDVGKQFAFLIPDDRKMYKDIFVPLDKLGGAKTGDKVQVQITEWPDAKKSPMGEVLEVMGRPGLHETEMNAIVAEFGFDSKFAPEIEKEAEKIPFEIPKEDIKGRRDFRDILTFTIDPEDAKDFDDAISYNPLANGHLEVGVHIADVSHYVRENSPLDKEAYRRATSVYLVDRTIPMLPEKLSNGVCSLRPNEDKLTFSAVFELDENGKIFNEWFGRTVIHSKRRFTYEDAQERLDSGEGDLAKELKTLNNIAHKLREARFKNGAVNFETEEVKFKLAEDGTPLSVYIKVRKDAHKLVEEFMLLANKKVAEFIFKKHKPKPYLYRTHESPNMEKLTLFGNFAKRFGIKIDTASQKSLSKSFNDMLQKVEGRPEQNILQGMAIRTMAKAKYTTKSTEHYGLAFDFYTHFTSPIRRYPDVLAHRLLEDYLEGKPGANPSRLEDQCKHSSEMEVKAAEAERASVKYKQVEFMKGSVGKIFEGIISGVTEWGLYVEVRESRCEGMVRVNNMRGDMYEFDEKNMCLRGLKKKRTFGMGDPVTIKVMKADMDKRQLDFDLVM